MQFKKNDVVVVTSSTNYRDRNDCKYTICTVVAVGKFDLICEKPDLVYRKHFKISKKRCQKIDMTCEYDQHKTVPAKVGDLVMSIVDRYDTGTVQATGIVEKIIYNPIDQDDLIYYVRTGQKLERCYLKNLIILEHN